MTCEKYKVTIWWIWTFSGFELLGWCLISIFHLSLDSSVLTTYQNTHLWIHRNLIIQNKQTFRDWILNTRWLSKMLDLKGMFGIFPSSILRAKESRIEIYKHSSKLPSIYVIDFFLVGKRMAIGLHILCSNQPSLHFSH